MTRLRRAIVLAGFVAFVGAAWYLHDPPWVATLTSGMRDWEVDDTGARFRWTAGRANFYVPSTAQGMTLPLRALLPSADGRPVIVSISVDDRWLTDVSLADPSAWSLPRVPLPRRPSSRSFRRVELRVSRTVGNFNLGVQVGEVRLE